MLKLEVLPAEQTVRGMEHLISLMQRRDPDQVGESVEPRAAMHAGAFMLVYLAMYCWYLHKGFLLLRSRPYNSFRVGNILVRIQVACQIIRALETC